MKRLVPFVVALVYLASLPAPVLATPGFGFGDYLWFQPGSTNLNGTLRRYDNFSFLGSTTAGSGMGNQYSTCQTNLGRLPSGWYDSANGHMVDNKNGTAIDGRAWGLEDKVCNGGSTLRTELFIHTEETVSNGQNCTSAPDDPHCWEGTFDYASQGCVKVSHPTSVSTLHTWWHSAAIGGAHSTAYTNILYVSTTGPPS